MSDIDAGVAILLTPDGFESVDVPTEDHLDVAELLDKFSESLTSQKRVGKLPVFGNQEPRMKEELFCGDMM